MVLPQKRSNATKGVDEVIIRPPQYTSTSTTSTTTTTSSTCSDNMTKDDNNHDTHRIDSDTIHDDNHWMSSPSKMVGKYKTRRTPNKMHPRKWVLSLFPLPFLLWILV